MLRLRLAQQLLRGAPPPTRPTPPADRGRRLRPLKAVLVVSMLAAGAAACSGGTASTRSAAGPTGACRAGDPLADVYHPDRLRVIETCTTVSGAVRSVYDEPDGDVHFDLQLDPAYTHLLTPASY